MLACMITCLAGASSCAMNDAAHWSANEPVHLAFQIVPDKLEATNATGVEEANGSYPLRQEGTAPQRRARRRLPGVRKSSVESRLFVRLAEKLPCTSHT